MSSTPSDWFCATEIAFSERTGRIVVVHAKRFGTNATACGRPATNMRKDWDLRFDAGDGSPCSWCAELVQAHRAFDRPVAASGSR